MRVCGNGCVCGFRIPFEMGLGGGSAFPGLPAPEGGARVIDRLIDGDAFLKVQTHESSSLRLPRLVDLSSGRKVTGPVLPKYTNGGGYIGGISGAVDGRFRNMGLGS